MYIVADSLDDLMRKVLRAIVNKGKRVKARKGSNKEIFGAVLEVRNPTARLSRTETKGTVFSCLGETLWYLASSNKADFIKYYIPLYSKFAERDGTVHGAYGPRIFAMRGKVDQISTLIDLLRRHPTSRKAVLQIFNAEDLLSNPRPQPCPRYRVALANVAESCGFKTQLQTPGSRADSANDSMDFFPGLHFIELSQGLDNIPI